MDRKSVASSNIASIGYAPSTLTLEVEFNNSTIYQYFDVPEFVYQEFMGASSKGKFLNGSIKGNYRYTKL